MGSPILLDVKVTPGASQNRVEAWEGDVLRIRVRGVPEKGRVNDELRHFLADQLGIAPSRITLVRGATSRLKRLSIEGITRLDLLKLHP